MIRMILCFCLLCVSAPSIAAVSMSSIEIGGGLRVERETNGVTLEGQPMFSLGAEVEVYPFLSVLTEFSMFSDGDSNSILSTDREHYEIIAWLRYRFLSRDLFSLHFGGGLGAFWEQVTTELGSLSETANSDLQYLYGGQVGGDYYFAEQFSVGLDLRLVGHTNGEVTPVFDSTARLKYLF